MKGNAVTDDEPPAEVIAAWQREQLRRQCVDLLEIFQAPHGPSNCDYCKADSSPPGDESAEVDTTEAEVDAMLAKGLEARLENLSNALELIRWAATTHYLGQGFNPEHMRSIANLASDALAGEEIPAPPDPEEIRAAAAAKFQRFKALINWPENEDGNIPVT